MRKNHLILSFVLIIFSFLYSQQSKWTIRNPLPSNAHLENIMWDGNRFIAVGLRGTIITSDEGNVWTKQNSGTCNYLNGITKREEQIVVSGADGIFLTSSDGVNWSSKTVCDCPLYKILWTGNQFVAIGSGNYEEGVIVTSHDGDNWNKDTVCENMLVGNIIWTDSQLVCPCTDTILVSEDCINWSKYYTGDSIIVLNVAFSGEKFVGVARNQISTSNDCKTWIKQPVTFNPGDYITSIIWDGNQFALTMYNNYYGGESTHYYINELSINQIMTSPDGISWTKHPTGTNRSLNKITKGNNKYVAVGRYGTIISSSDGDNWTQHCKGSILRIIDITWSGEQLIAVGDSGLILTSPEGIEWTKQSVNTNEELCCIEWTGDQFVVGCEGQYRKKQSVTADNDSLILTSSDGINWEKHYTTDSVDKIYDIVSWTNNRVIAIGPGSAKTVVLCSYDGGMNWEEYSIIEGFKFMCIAWTGERFVAGGFESNPGYSTGVIMVSEDGKSWVKKFEKDSFQVMDIVWTGTQLAATLELSSIITSPDGITWTEHTNTGGNGITWTGDCFVAVGGGGWIITSTDGIVWEQQLPPTHHSLYSVTSTEKRAVAVGGYGTIITCPLSGLEINQSLKHSTAYFSIKSVTHNYINFSCNFKNKNSLHIGLYNLLGQKLFCKYYENASTIIGRLSIPINTIAPGMYYLRVKTGEISEVQKVIIGAFE